MVSTEIILHEILQERHRQLELGYVHDYDCQWNMEQLTMAAAYYAIPSKMRDNYKNLWPWSREKFSQGIGYKGRRHELIKAAALLIAELERIDSQPADSIQSPPYLVV